MQGILIFDLHTLVDTLKPTTLHTRDNNIFPSIVLNDFSTMKRSSIVLLWGVLWRKSSACTHNLFSYMCLLSLFLFYEHMYSSISVSLNWIASWPKDWFLVVVCKLGWALWNRNSFEFKFVDTRLSSYYENKIGPIKKKICCVLTLLSQHTTNKKNLMGPILFLYYEESLVSSNLNSRLLWFYSVRPNVNSRLN